MTIIKKINKKMSIKAISRQDIVSSEDLGGSRCFYCGQPVEEKYINNKKTIICKNLDCFLNKKTNE